MAEEELTGDNAEHPPAEKVEDRPVEQSEEEPAEKTRAQAAEEGEDQAEERPATDKNTVTIEDAGPCKKKVIIEIPAETIKAETDKQYETLRKEAVVPGFRRGRAPRRLLEKRFGKDTSQQIKLKLLAEAAEAAVKDIQPLGEPDFEYEEIELPAEGPMKFEFEIEVRPDFDLPELDAIPVEKPKLEVTDEHVEAEIDHIRKYSGLWTPRKDEPVRINDQIIADVTLKTEDVEEAEKLNEIEVYVRQNGFVGGIPVEKLDEILEGAKTGQKIQTTVEVPETYFKEQYRGKKVDITIEVKDIKYLKPADLTEDFLARLQVESADELREKTRDGLQDRVEQQARAEMTRQIQSYLLENTDFDLPLDIVAEQASTVLQRQYTNMLMRGLRREQIEEQVEQLKAASDEEAKQQLKTFFLMDKVADKLGIEVTEEEINGQIAQLAIQRGLRPERLREDMHRNGSLAQFRLEVRQSRSIAKLLESAKVTEAEPGKKQKPAKKKAGKKTEKKAAKDADQSAKKPAKKAKSAPKKKSD